MTFINDKHKFIFIEIEKTGTSSFDYLFSKQYGLKNELKDVRKQKRHTIARIVENKFPEKWKEYTTFAIIRNPWERYISWAKWKHNKMYDKYKISKNLLDMEKTVFQIITTSRSQSTFIFDKDEIIIDKLIRFENLQQEWDDFAPMLGLSQQTLPHRNKTDTYNYRNYYDPITINIVRKKEEKFIKYSEYTYK